MANSDAILDASFIVTEPLPKAECLFAEQDLGDLFAP